MAPATQAVARSDRLHVLVLEDNPDDAALVHEALLQHGFDLAVQVVDTEHAFCTHLTPELDVILADYALPAFTALRALALLKQRQLDIPFIIVSGVISEEVAVEAMKQGAADYLLKDRLARLGAAVEHALEERQLRCQKRQAYRTLKQLSRRLIEVQEAERRHIALELHDEVGQMLTALRLVLDIDEASLPAVDRNRLRRAQDLVESILAKVHDLSLNLRPAMLDDLGLLPALLWFVRQYTEQTSIQVDFQHARLSGQRFAAEVEIAAYRIVQEALTNVARHAETDRVSVQAAMRANTLYIQVADAGRGFDLERVMHRHETGGLSGMQERAALVGGEATIEATPDHGVCIHVRLPLGDDKNVQEVDGL